MFRLKWAFLAQLFYIVDSLEKVVILRRGGPIPRQKTTKAPKKRTMTKSSPRKKAPKPKAATVKKVKPKAVKKRATEAVKKAKSKPAKKPTKAVTKAKTSRVKAAKPSKPKKQVDPRYNVFRAYDIRGLAGKELTSDLAYRIGAAYGTFMGEHIHEVVVGYDHRHSSPSLKSALIRGLRATGLDVIDVGCVPTPVLYFAIAHYKRAGGIEVTASHNTKEYNGFKLQKEKAHPIYAENGLYKIRDIALSGKFNLSKKKTDVHKEDVINSYIDHLSRITCLSRPLKVVIDCGNGVCGSIPQRIFERLGCKVITIYGEPDGDFPNHIADPHDESTLVDLKKAVVEHGADLGIAYDGDGDRFGVIDRKGRIISGDNLVMMLARKVLKRNRGPVVVEVRSSLAMLEDIKEHGGVPIISKAGHAYVLDEVFKNDAVFGGEITGHMYMPLKYYDYDDGMFLSLMMAEVVSEVYDFCGYVDSLPKYFASREYAVPFDDDIKFDVIRRIVTNLKRSGYDVLAIDGARVNFEDGWALVRASNTAPQVKCRFEGRTPEALERIKAEMKGILKKYGIVLPDDGPEDVDQRGAKNQEVS